MHFKLLHNKRKWKRNKIFHYHRCPSSPVVSLHFLTPFCLPYDCIFPSTCAILHSFCSSTLCFSVSPIPHFFAMSTLYVVQLFFVQETLSLVLLSFGPLIVTFSALHKSYHFPFHHPPFYANPCSPWRKPLYPTMFFYLPPYISQRCHFLFFLPFSTLWTLPFLMPFFPTFEALWPFLHNLLSPHLLHSILHDPTLQHFEPISYHHFLLLFLSTSTLPDKMPEPPILPTYPSFSAF